MSNVCEACGSTLEAKVEKPKVHEHAYAVAYTTKTADGVVTRLHCRNEDCPNEWKTVEGDKNKKSLTGQGDAAIRMRKAIRG